MLTMQEWEALEDMKNDLEVLEWLYRHGRGPNNAAEELSEWKEKIAKNKEELKSEIDKIVTVKPTVTTISKEDINTPPNRRDNFGRWLPRRGN